MLRSLCREGFLVGDNAGAGGDGGIRNEDLSINSMDDMDDMDGMG